jgi:DNA-binding NarL/FixJ family response regulator
MITIAILEDNRDVAESLKDLINDQPDMACNYVYYSAEDAMVFIPKYAIDILILDIGLPRGSGIDVLNYIQPKGCVKEFCIFTIYEDDERLFTSLQAGARGYILKGTPPEKILESIRDLYLGGSPMSPMIARRVLEKLQHPGKEVPRNELPLTQRENEILILLSKGYLYKEISEKLSLTVGTIKQHIHKMYEKLQVSNKTEAINKLYGRS